MSREAEHWAEWPASTWACKPGETWSAAYLRLKRAGLVRDSYIVPATRREKLRWLERTLRGGLADLRCAGRPHRDEIRRDRQRRLDEDGVSTTFFRRLRPPLYSGTWDVISHVEHLPRPPGGIPPGTEITVIPFRDDGRRG